MGENGGEKYIDLFTNEFLASSRVRAVELMGEESVAELDSAIEDFVEGEEEHNPDIVMGFLNDISGDALKFNNYPIISFAITRSIKDNPDEGLEKRFERALELVLELQNIKNKHE